jgi:hypothetical protein
LADAYAEVRKKLSTETIKYSNEQRRNRRLESQVNDYVDALQRSTADSIQVGNQYQMLCTVNIALSQELAKAKLIVETLEAVILLLYTTSKQTPTPVPVTDKATDE